MSGSDIHLAISGLPLPMYFITTMDENGKPNIMTGCYFCQVSEKSPMIVIAVHPSRYTHEIIKKTGEFVINGILADPTWKKHAEFCGSNSGRTVDKLSKINLETEPASKVKAPLIKGAHTNLECIVVESHEVGDRTIFVAEVVDARTNYKKPLVYYYGDMVNL